MDLAVVNGMSQASFNKVFGSVFEHSPWVAEAAWQPEPFASFQALHQAMCRVVRNAPRPQIEQLLCMHPDLAGREAQAGTMTSDSVSEQSSAGLDALSAQEMQKMLRLNSAFREKHRFPFIIAVRNYSKGEIFSEFERRLHNDTDTELGNNLEQIFNIVEMRLERIFAQHAS